MATVTCKSFTFPLKRLLALAFVVVAFFSASSATHADVLAVDFVRATHLIGASQGSTLSDLAKTLISGGFETSGGNKVRLDKWYSANWVDTRFDFMTQITPRFGVLWGFSTGERAEKYTIDPSFKYGFLAVYPLSKASKLSFTATTIIGGRLNEHSCTADYGAIGGVQEVNCRMAATEIDPAETLNYLLKKDPANKNQVTLTYTINF